MQSATNLIKIDIKIRKLDQFGLLLNSWRPPFQAFLSLLLWFVRIPYLSVLQCLFIWVPCVGLGLWHYLVIYTCFNPKVVV